MATTKGYQPSPSIFKPAGKPGVPGLGAMARPPLAGAGKEKAGASVGREGLEAAAARGDFEALESMIAMGVPFNPGRTRPGSEACAALIQAVGDMFAAASGGDAATCRELAGLVPPGARDRLGMTALHLAAEAGSAECAQALLDAGARIGALDGNRRTALHCACEEGRADVVDLLISLGADPEARATGGLTAFDFAEAGECAGQISGNWESMLEAERERRERVASEWEAGATGREAAREAHLAKVRAFLAGQRGGAK